MNSINRIYKSLPLIWNSKTAQNDRLWLESMIRNAAPFSDWWTKARIVQLAYSTPQDATPQTVDALPTYAAMISEKSLAEAVRSLCNLRDYPEFAAKVNEDYVIDTLNRWSDRQFHQAISRNFEVYADRYHPNIFLVTSTATTSLDVDRELPPLDRFRPLFNIDEMARIVRARGCRRITLRTHGYASPPSLFYHTFIQESESLTLKGPINQTGTLEEAHFYIGYYWPSEQPFVSPSLWVDYQDYGGIIVKFLTVLGSLAAISGTLLYLFLKIIGIPVLTLISFLPGIHQILQKLNFQAVTGVAVQWHWLVLTVLLLWLLLFQILRVVVYLRDRYRAIHYGAPDLAEFFWRLDKGIGIQVDATKGAKTPVQYWDANSKSKSESLSDRSPKNLSISVNILGHSLGALVVTNVLRILSDRFGKDDRIDEEKREIGEYLILDKLILAAPDIPLEFLREGRNNYVRSAILRCRSIYLLSSDRDIILRYLSTLANWFTEPSLEMSGLRLGNVYLKPANAPHQPPEYQPYIRVMLRSQPAAKQTSAYELFEKFNYLDCSEMRGVNGINLPLNPLTAFAIDLGNIVLYAFGKIDAHGGYFWTETPSFAILQFLLTHDTFSGETSEMNPSLAQSKILFWPSQPFLRDRDR